MVMSAQTHFGAEQVTPEEKTRRVGGVFDAVAPRYDAMNDLMSFGSHRPMKRIAVEMAHLRPGKRVLDLAGGTGDMAALAAGQVARNDEDSESVGGHAVLADLNPSMLAIGRERLLNRGCAGISYCQADAAALPFADAAFDAVLVAFGIRNFTHQEAALREMRRVLNKRGVAVVLEFSQVENPLLACGYAAFKSTWPMLGKVIAGSAAPYRYLVESIDRHPDRETFAQMMQNAGFQTVEHHPLLAGAAAIHRGIP